MRNSKKIIVTLIVFCLYLIPFYTDASTVTYERDSTTLSVPSDINVTSSNRNAIINTPLVDASEKIYDFADLFTDSEEVTLYSKVTEFINKYDMDMVIVTIDYNNKTSEAYADDFFDYNEFGKNSSRDGILYLIDMDNRYVYISTSGNCILYFDDDRIDDILDYAYEYLVDGDYYESAVSFINDSSKYVEKGIPSSNSNYYIDENGNYVKKPKKKEVNFIISTVAALIVSTVTVLIFKSKHKGVRLATNADYYFDSSRTKDIVKNDRFISTHTTKTPIPRDSGSSGGGGSHTHSSSSGRSHGGGGRHF